MLLVVIAVSGVAASRAAARKETSPAGSSVASSPARPDEKRRPGHARLPLRFEANVGQTDGQVKFLSRGNGYTLFLTGAETVLALRTPGEKAAFASIRMQWLGANPSPRTVGTDDLPGKSHYFIGSDPKKWHTDVPSYASVRVESVYPGVDAIYYGREGRLEYDLVISPGADPKAMALGFKGVDEVEVNGEGDLVLHTAVGSIRQQRPIAYQQVDGVRREIACRFVRRGDRIGFDVPAYDEAEPLIIDPVLTYSTFLGGNSADEGRGIAVDASGNAYVTGSTSSVDFPTLNGLQPTLGGVQDAFVTKLNAQGTMVVYSTYLGGGASEAGYSIAVDSSGNAYVTGTTSSSDFPTTLNAFDPTLSGTQDAFVTKLTTTGTLAYSTYLGGVGLDEGRAIAVDASGNAYVAGRTASTNFPTLNAFQLTFGGTEDAFVTKLDAAGTTLIYSTYLGGSRVDQAFGIAVDASGNAYVTGTTSSSDFPAMFNAFDSTLSGTQDAFVTKLATTGALVYSTYLGGVGLDEGRAIAVDASGNAYVAGRTASTDFPTTPNAFQPTLGGTEDAFVTKLDALGTALLYSTFLGGSGSDLANGIVVDTAGNASVTGTTSSSSFPTLNGLSSTLSGASDAFVSCLNAQGNQLSFSTFFGGSGGETGYGIAVDAFGDLYITGVTSSSDCPTTPNTFDTTVPGASDAFVARIGLGSGGPPPTIGVSPTSFSFTATAGGANPVDQTLNVTNTGGGTLTWSANDDATWLSVSPPTGTAPSAVTISVNIAGLSAGTYNGTITVTATGATNSPVSVPVTLTVNPVVHDGDCVRKMQDLIDAISSRTLKAGLGTALKKKLENAMANARTGDKSSAAGEIRALINQVNAQRGKGIAPADADAWVAAARAILDCLAT
jgi:hypothetical protein